jgi:septum formation protein
MPPPLILASSSPRRRDLLAERRYQFRIVTAAVEETLPPHLTVRETVLLNARRKGSAIAALHPGACVIAADTLVALDGRPLGKPASLDDARAVLAALGGRTHQVFSGVWIEHRAAGSLAAFIEASHVRFRPLAAGEIEDYLRRVHVLDKAGAYAAQEDPIGLIEAIHGSRTNVIGLPMERLVPMLARRGCVPGQGFPTPAT